MYCKNRVEREYTLSVVEEQERTDLSIPSRWGNRKMAVEWSTVSHFNYGRGDPPKPT